MSLPNEGPIGGFTLAAENAERVQETFRDLRRVAQTNRVSLAVVAARIGIDEEAAEAALSGRLDLTLSDLQEVAIAVGARLDVSASPAPLMAAGERVASTAEVRNLFAGGGTTHSEMLRRAAMFNAWLADHDQQVRAQIAQEERDAIIERNRKAFQEEISRAHEILRGHH